MRALLVLLVFATAAWPQTFREKKPGKAPRGKLCAWATKAGLKYLYRVPKNYSKKRGADLTLKFVRDAKEQKDVAIVANWPIAEALSADFLVLPVGANAPDPLTAEQVNLLLEEFRSTYKINAVGVTGGGTGASFALYFAGHHPEAVNGVSVDGPLAWPEIKPATGDFRPPIHIHAHSIYYREETLVSAITLLERYEAEKWPRLSLSVWHANEEHISWDEMQGIRWSTAVQSDDPKRLAAAYKIFCTTFAPRARNMAALYDLAGKIVLTQGVPPNLVSRAKKCRAAIERLAEKHVKKIAAEVGTSSAGEFEDRPWVGHVRAFLWGFRGVPARDKFEGEWRARLTAHDNRAKPFLARFASLKDTDKAGAFAALAAAVRIAPLATGCQGTPAMEALSDWRQHHTKRYRLAKADVRTAERFCTARDEGIRSYLSVNQSFVPR